MIHEIALIFVAITWSQKIELSNPGERSAEGIEVEGNNARQPSGWYAERQAIGTRIRIHNSTEKKKKV